MAEPLKKVDVSPSTSAIYDASPRTPAVHHEVHHEGRFGGETVWTAKDTVRWGPILAGLFTAISSLVVFAVLGLAVGLSSVNPGDQLSQFGMGAGWWGAVSALLAFLIGGFVAGCTASLVRGTPHGAVNGLMVWAVTIPMLLFLLTGGVAAVFRTAGGVASTTMQAAVPVAGQMARAAAEGKTPETMAAQVRTAAANVQREASATAQEVKQSVTPEKVQEVAEKAAPGAWWTLGSLLLALVAAVIGGMAGGRWHAGTERDRLVVRDELQTARV